MNLRESPYRGLVPYSEEDAPFFFGREREREIIAANLLASRLTILYGASGVGKTSVLRAGVVPDLRREADSHAAASGRREFHVVYFNAWRDDPIAGLREAVIRSLTPAGGRTVSQPRGRSLIALLEESAGLANGDLLLVLDQFEDFFLYHDARACGGPEGAFAEEFPRAVRAHDLGASFLISIREDALAKLDRFKSRIPGLFGNLLRIDHLDPGAARAAVECPLAEYNRRVPPGQQVTIEPGLTTRVLDELQTGGELAGVEPNSPRPSTIPPAPVPRVEAPYLQLVMTRLWRAEREEGSLTLRQDTLDRLKGARRIAETHLDESLRALSVADQGVAAAVLHYLVTPSGAKVAHTAADLATYACRPRADVDAILERLSGADLRILRPVAPSGDHGDQPPRYEIFHDVLAPAIVDWRRRYVHEQERASDVREAEQQRRRASEQARVARRLRWLTVGLASILVLTLMVAIYAVIQRRLAVDRARESTARALAIAAIRNLDLDSERSTLLALHAVATTYAAGAGFTAEAEAALQRAVQEWELRWYDPGDVDVVLARDGARLAAASSDGTIRVLDEDGREPIVLRLPGDSPVVAIAMSRDGSWLAAADPVGAVTVWPLASAEDPPLHVEHGATLASLAFSPDLRQLATAAWDGTSRLWNLATREPRVTLAGHGDAVVDVAFAPDGALVATASWDRTARLWNLERAAAVEMVADHAEPVAAVAFSHDGTRLATGDDSGLVRLWNVANGRELLTLDGHSGRIVALAFGPGDRVLATASWNDVRIWDSGTGANHRAWSDLPGEVQAIAFDGDGRRLVTARGDGALRAFVLDLETLVRAAQSHISRSLTADECRRYLQVAECPTLPWPAPAAESDPDLVRKGGGDE